MIFIVARFETKPDYSERWPELVAPLTAATRAEPGNLWFDWSRSLDNPAEYVLVEAFRDLPQALASTPRIISQTIVATGWSETAEMKVN